MLTRFFQKSEPISFVSIVILLFALIFIQFVVPANSNINPSNALQTFGVFLFFTFSLFLSSFIISRNHLTQANYYAILFFVLLLGFFPSVFTVSKISISHLFVLVAARRLYSIHSKKELLSKLFDSGFYLGVAFLINPQTILYILLIYASYFIYIKIIDKNLLLPIVGFGTPLFIVFTYYFVLDKTEVFRSLIELNVVFDLQKVSPEKILLPLILMAVLLIVSLFKISSNSLSFESENKNSNKLVIAHLVLSILILLLNNLKIEETILYLFFPTAILIGILFNLLTKKGVKEVILYCFLLLAFSLPFWN